MSNLLGASTPAIANTTDAASYTLGMRFFADTPGTVTAIRFYKSGATSDTRIVGLYDQAGTLLAQVSTTNEIDLGWNTATITSTHITSTATYITACGWFNGLYPSTTSGFATPVNNAPLHCASNAGTYNDAAGFNCPLFTFQKSNYFVDLEFTADSGATQQSFTAVGLANITTLGTVPIICPQGL